MKITLGEAGAEDVKLFLKTYTGSTWSGGCRAAMETGFKYRT